jgi:ATP-dependent Zn protease
VKELILKEHDALEKIAEILLERETLEGEEFRKLLADFRAKPPRRTKAEKVASDSA